MHNDLFKLNDFHDLVRLMESDQLTYKIKYSHGETHYFLIKDRGPMIEVHNMNTDEVELVMDWRNVPLSTTFGRHVMNGSVEVAPAKEVLKHFPNYKGRFQMMGLIPVED